jgi:YVTN family beta-propeller protein
MILGQGYEAIAAKYDVNGNMLWNGTYKSMNNSASQPDRLYGAAENNTCYILFGSSYNVNQQGYIALVNKGTGAKIANVTYGGPGAEYFYSGVIDPADGDLFAAGTTTSWGNGSTDAWLIKINGFNDKEAWNRTFGGSGAGDVAYNVTLLKDGNVLMSGTYNALRAFANKYDQGSSLQWSGIYQAPMATAQAFFYGASERPDGTLFLGGYGAIGSSNYNSFLVEANPFGTQIMNLTIGYGAANDFIFGMSPDSRGNLYLAGYSQSNDPVPSAWIVKVNTVNNVLGFAKAAQDANETDGYANVTVQRTPGYNQQYLFLSDNTNSLYRMYNVDGYLKQNVPSYVASAQPRGLVYSPLDGYMYGIGYNNNITYWNVSTNTVTAGDGNIWVWGKNPFEGIVSPDGKYLYVTLYSDAKVIVINTTTHQWERNITTLANPTYVTTSPDGRIIYVAHAVGNTLRVMWAENGTVIADVTTQGTANYGLWLNNDGTKLYIAENSPGKIAVLWTSNNTITHRVNVGLNPRAIAGRLDGTKLYVANNGAANITVIDTATDTRVANISVTQTGAWGICANPTDNNYMYATAPNSLMIINTTTDTVERQANVPAAAVRDIVCLPAAQVNYRTVDGTALAGTDYKNTSGILYFGRNDYDRTISVPLIDRPGFQGQRSFNVSLDMTLFACPGANQSANVTISDLPTVAFNQSDYLVDEGAGTVTLNATRTGTGACTVNYVTLNNTATYPGNYTYAEGRLDFAADEVYKTFTIVIADAGVYEDFNRSFFVNLSAGPGCLSGMPRNATVWINETNPLPVLPVADFIANQTTGLTPLCIQFTDATTGYPASWDWDFGDVAFGSANGTSQSPVHTYTDAGTYTVTLTATNINGSNTFRQVGYIVATAPPPPVAGFHSNLTSGPVPLCVQFTDDSTGEASSWQWDFGDGTPNSTLQNPAHSYTTPGVYSVTLTVGNYGGSDAIEKVSLITALPVPPVSDFHANITSGISPLCVGFTDDSTGTVTGWQWDFGDGSANATGQNPVYVYAVPGTYTVTMTATNDGGSGAIQKTGYIHALDPSLDAAFHADLTEGTAPLAVAFTDDSVGAITGWQWDFGDGSGNSTLQSPTHTYTVPGTYTVMLTIGNGVGLATLAMTGYITALPQPPVADFTGDPAGGVVPLTVRFRDASAGTVAGWQWDFGDGSANATERDPEHVYAVPGTYTITLTASNSGGQSTLSRASYITVLPGAPVADFVANVTGGYPPLAVQFDDLTTGTVTGWQWDFGDGTPNGTEQNPVHTYADIGSYNVTLTVSNPGGFDVISKSGYVSVDPSLPLARFSASPLTGIVPLTVIFSDLSENATAWSWSFGDGTINTSQNTTYTYGTPGTYQVNLTATNVYGSSISSLSITVDSPPAPVPSPVPVPSPTNQPSPDLTWSSLPGRDYNSPTPSPTLVPTHEIIATTTPAPSPAPTPTLNPSPLPSPSPSPPGNPLPLVLIGSFSLAILGMATIAYLWLRK